MIRPGFLTIAERNALRALARDGRSEGRVVRRANALVPLNDGWSCQEVAAALLIDDDTVRSWHALYAEHGLTGVVVFNHKGQPEPPDARPGSRAVRLGSRHPAA